MKTLGLIGGTSWISTIDYYKFINEGINEKLGGLEYAQCILYSFNYGEIKRLNDEGNISKVLELFIRAAQSLKQGGAEGLVLCANTMHMHADALEAQLNIPVIHIATATATTIKKMNLDTVGLLGTKFTMEGNFFKDRLQSQGIRTLIPEERDRDFIHKTIFDELGKGLVFPETKERYIEISHKLAADGAQGVILGCTEIPLLISQSDVSVPVFDTLRIHTDAAVAFALGETQ